MPSGADGGSLHSQSGSELRGCQVVARRTRSRPVETCDQSVPLDSRKPPALEVSARDLQRPEPLVRRNLRDDPLCSRPSRPERHCPATVGCLRCRHTVVVFDRPHRTAGADLTDEQRRLCRTETHTTNLERRPLSRKPIGHRKLLLRFHRAMSRKWKWVPYSFGLSAGSTRSALNTTPCNRNVPRASSSKPPASNGNPSLIP